MSLRFPLAAFLVICLGGPSIATADAGPSAARDRIESLCHAWTASPCILTVSGFIRSARSGDPLPGKQLRFVAGDRVICASITDDAGRASCTGVVPSGRVVAETGYRIVFDGEGRYLARSAEGHAIVPPRGPIAH